MMHKTKEVPTESEVREECRHYWIIAEASGPTSRGVCKFCGMKREFRNSWDSSYVGRDTGIFGLPNLLEDESDKKPEDSEVEKSNADP